MKQILLIAIAVSFMVGCDKVKTKDNLPEDRNKAPANIHPYEKIILQDKSSRSRLGLAKLIKNETTDSGVNGENLVKILNDFFSGFWVPVRLQNGSFKRHLQPKR